MEDYDGLVGIYSKNNVLTEKLRERFNQKYLEVKIFDDFHKVDLSQLSYLIINLLDFRDQLADVNQFVRNLECKVLVIHPLFVKRSEKFVCDSEIQNLLRSNPNLGILLVPDVLGKGISFDQSNISHDLIMQSVLSDRIKVDSSNLLINTISVNKLAERVVKDTFSFGISGEALALIGPRKSKRTFLKKYLGIADNNIINQKEESDVSELYSSVSAQVDFSLSLAVKNTKSTFSTFTESKVEERLIPLVEEVEKIDYRSIQNNALIKNKIKRLLYLFLFIMILLSTPIVLMAVAILLLFVSTNIVFSNNDLSTKLLHKSIFVSNLTRNLSFGNNFIYDTSNIIYEFGVIGAEGSTLVNSGREFVNKVMGDTAFDLSIYSNNISASLDKIHTDISFLQSDINELDGLVGNILRSYLNKKKFSVGEYKMKIYDTKNLFSRSSILLGNDRPKKYLILFQNNMELRPTGGFIGSFALMTFDKGKLSEIVVNDVYSADGQLKGHVDPPEPIRKHLGEGGWYLRDSNWDPSFPISASKAEWFLDKEIGEKVDGVIAIDLYFIKRLLMVTGPIKLVDFETIINSDNLYQIIQSEVEEKFFPGSIKKATVLTSLSQSLIMELKTLDGSKYLSLFKEVYESLERKHIQIYLHDNNAAEAITSLGYSGEIKINTDCGLRCLNDSYQLVDANLGVNKSNYFIKRSQDLSLSVSKDLIGHELFVTYDNQASPAVGNLGVYKNYARLIVPKESQIGGVRVYETSGEYYDVQYDVVDTDTRKEVGFLVELLPGTQKRVQLVWNLKSDQLSLGGEYNINVLKQAGTDQDSLSVIIRSTDLALTGKSLSSYNTTLAKDFKAKMFFKP